MAKGNKNELTGQELGDIAPEISNVEENSSGENGNTPTLSEVVGDVTKSRGGNPGIISFRPGITYDAMGKLEEMEKRFPNIDRSIFVEMGIEALANLYAADFKAGSTVSNEFATALGVVWSKRGQALIK